MGTNAMGRESNKTGAAGAGRSGGIGGGGSNADRDRAARAGLGGFGRGGFGGGVGRGTLSQQQDRINAERARRAGNAAPGVGTNANRGTLSQQQDRINTNRALARSNTAPGVGNYSDAMDDYNNIGGSFLDKIGNFLASNFGFNEIDPSTQAPKSFVDRTAADWGFDPAGLAGSVVGGAFGVPMLGTAFDRLSQMVGRPLEMNMGTEVFGLDGAAPTGTPADPSNMAARNASYLSGRSVRPKDLSIQTASGTPGGVSNGGGSTTTGGMVGDNADASSAERDFGGNSSAVAASRSPFNSSIGGFSGGGYAMGPIKGGSRSRSSRTGSPTPANLAEGLRRYRGPYEARMGAT